MLIGILPDTPECKCRVIKFVDRIWLEDTGNANILRRIVFEVDSESPKPLDEFHQCLPTLVPSGVEDLSATGLDPHHHFNRQARGGEFRLIKSPKAGEKAPHGIVSYDGIENIKVFTEILQHGGELKALPYGHASMIRVRFPEPIMPGERCQFIFRFTVDNVCAPVSQDTSFVKVLWLKLPYFDVDGERFANLLAAIKGRRCMPIMKFYKQLPPVDGETRHAGGLDIFLYLPPNYSPKHETFTRTYSTQLDNRLIDGSQAEPGRNKLIWRLKHLIPDPPEEMIPQSRPPQVISGAIAPISERASHYFDKIDKQLNDITVRFSAALTNTTANLESLSNTVNKVNSDLEKNWDGVQQVIRTLSVSNRLAIVALVASILGVLITTIVAITS